MNAVVARFKSFWKQPYAAQMDAGGWFLFIGLLLFCMIGWKLILKHINVD